MIRMDDRGSFAGKFKATVLWKEMLNFVFTHAEYHQKKVDKKLRKLCVYGEDVVNLTLVFLQRVNGSVISVADLSKENALKVCQKMVDTKILVPLIMSEYDKFTGCSYFVVADSYSSVEACPRPRDCCLNPRLPLCQSELICSQEDGRSSRAKQSLRQNNGRRRFSESFGENFQRTSKRRSLNSHDVLSSFRSVRPTKRRSYNLANRHSDDDFNIIPFVDHDSWTLTKDCSVRDQRLDRSKILSRILFDCDLSFLEEILSSLVSNDDSADELRGFVNRTFAESEVQTVGKDGFINASLKCLTVIPDGLHSSRCDRQMKFVCLEATKKYFRDRCLLAGSFSGILAYFVLNMLDKPIETNSPRLSDVDFCCLFTRMLPDNHRTSLLSLLRFIKVGCDESTSFDREVTNKVYMLNMFVDSVIKHPDLSFEKRTEFVDALIKNLDTISSKPSDHLLSGPRLRNFITDDEYRSEGIEFTKIEISDLIEYIEQLPSMADCKKKIVIKKLKKYHSISSLN